MKVQNHNLIHIHKIGTKDDLWETGKQFRINKDYQGRFLSIIKNYKPIYTDFDGNTKNIEQVPDELAKAYYNGDNNKIEKYLNLLENHQKNILTMQREIGLEEYRKVNYCHLPSRINSLFLADERSIDYWLDQLSYTDELKVFNVSVTGKLFKSSENFYSDIDSSNIEIYQNAEKYWNPIFKTEKDLEKAEYLFQGDIRVLGLRR